MMTTTNEVGTEFSIGLASSVNNVSIDFGDGVKLNKTIGTNLSEITGILGITKTIKIYGTGITQLFCENKSLVNLDITNCLTLKTLNCQKNKLVNLDLTHNTALIDLYCGINNLTSLDVSKNANLWYLGCTYNKLSAIDVANNSALKLFTCEHNDIRFSGLHLKEGAFDVLSYVPQNPIQIGKTAIINTVIDLNSEFSIQGIQTNYVWKTKGGNFLVEGTDYTIQYGRTTFIKHQTDSVYCVLTNTQFPDFKNENVLKTTYTLIELPTALTNHITNKVSVNVIDGVVQIALLDNANATIYDLYGRILSKKVLVIGTNTLKLNNKGLYIIKINGPNTSSSHRVLIE